MRQELCENMIIPLNGTNCHFLFVFKYNHVRKRFICTNNWSVFVGVGGMKMRDVKNLMIFLSTPETTSKTSAVNRLHRLSGENPLSTC